MNDTHPAPKHFQPVSRVSVLYGSPNVPPSGGSPGLTGRQPFAGKLAFAEKVHVIYDNDPPTASDGSAIYNSNGAPASKNSRAANGGTNRSFKATNREFSSQLKLEAHISYYDCLMNFMTACGLLMLLFAVLVPICTIVLSSYQGMKSLHAPGYLSLAIFGVIVVCVFLARSRLRKLNRLALYISLAVFSVLSIALSISLIVVGAIMLVNDSPAPHYGRGLGAADNLMEVLSMECAIASSGFITLFVSIVLLVIAIHFSRGCYRYYYTSGDTRRSSSSTSLSSELRTVIPASPTPTPVVAQRTRTAFPPRRNPPLIVSPSTAPEHGSRKGHHTPSEMSVSDIVINDVDKNTFEDVLQLPQTSSRPGTNSASTRRWGKTKNVLKAIMDIKQ